MELKDQVFKIVQSNQMQFDRGTTLLELGETLRDVRTSVILDVLIELVEEKKMRQVGEEFKCLQ